MSEQGFKVLSPTAILGYGFPEDSFRRGVEKRPDVIGVDAGSTDPGPYYLGAGKSFTSRQGVKRDLELILEAAVRTGTPFLIGSAGGCGAREHLDWTREIIEEIARENHLSFPMAVIPADIPKDDVLRALEEGRIHPVGAGPELSREQVERSTRIVAQMGIEPAMLALDQGPLVVLMGRAYDPVSFSAPAIRAGFDHGLSHHMGKILECAAIAASPGSGRDCVLATLREDCFELESLNPERRFTTTSAAAHTLYEKSDPYHLPGPGGELDLTQTEFEALDEARVRVLGSRYVPTRKYAIKLEGAAPIGYRTISIAGIRDPMLISRIDGALEAVTAQTQDDLQHRSKLSFHVYGRDGVMGPREPERDRVGHELGLVIEAIGPTQEESAAVCSFARSTLLHYGYPGRISTAGNLALLYSPSDIPCGQVFEFSVYHLMDVEDPMGYFPVEMCEVNP